MNKNKAFGYFLLFRFNRTIMVSMIAGTGAFISGAKPTKSLLIALIGWLLAVGGFSLDFYADREHDLKGPREKIRWNPISKEIISPEEGLWFSVAFILTSLAFLFFIEISGIFAWIAILLIVVGLALHIFNTPISRAFTLGALQTLYFLLGASSGDISTGILLLSGMFFFAMFGGRGLTDIRDYQQDSSSNLQTFTTRYGMKPTLYMIISSLSVSYILSFLAYLTGEFSVIYLYLDIAFILLGVICILVLIRNPSSNMADKLTLIFMMGEGSLISLAMVLGKMI